MSSFEAAVQAEVEKLPKVSRGARRSDQVYIAQDLDKAIRAAEYSARAMRYEYRNASNTVPPAAPSFALWRKSPLEMHHLRLHRL